MAAAIEPETIFRVGSFGFTNTLFTTLLVDTVLIGVVVGVYKNLQRIPGKLQGGIEMIIEYFYNLTEGISGKYVKIIFPWVMSFFLFIFIANLFGLLPGIGTIGFFEHDHGEKHLIPLLRPTTTDFNATFALATISLVVTHFFAIKYSGLRTYLSHFFSINPIFLFVGLLELVSEITKLFSLSFRLFGNIFAGEVVLVTISGLFAYVAPVPFMMLEFIVALVQALVFAMLTMVFMSILIKESH